MERHLLLHIIVERQKSLQLPPLKCRALDLKWPINERLSVLLMKLWTLSLETDLIICILYRKNQIVYILNVYSYMHQNKNDFFEKTQIGQ